MSVQEHTSSVAATTTSERSVYQSLFDKINLSPVSALKNVDAWQSDEALSDAAPADVATGGAAGAAAGRNPVLLPARRGRQSAGAYRAEP